MEPYDEAPLTKSQIRRLERELKDSRDPARYIIQEPLLAMFYNAEDDVWARHDPEGGTAFKRRKTALAVMRAIGQGKYSGYRVLKVKRVKDGRIQLPKGARRWRSYRKLRRRTVSRRS